MSKRKELTEGFLRPKKALKLAKPGSTWFYIPKSPNPHVDELDNDHYLLMVERFVPSKNSLKILGCYHRMRRDTNFGKLYCDPLTGKVDLTRVVGFFDIPGFKELVKYAKKVGEGTFSRSNWKIPKDCWSDKKTEELSVQIGEVNKLYVEQILVEKPKFVYNSL